MAKGKLFNKKKAPLKKDLAPPRYSFLFSYNPFLKRSLGVLGGAVFLIILLDLLKIGVWLHFKEKTQEALNQLLSPAKQALFEELSTLSLKAYFMDQNEKKKLLQKHQELQTYVEALEQEVHELSGMTRFEQSGGHFITAKVIGFPAKPFKNSMLLAAGKERSLSKNDPLVYGVKLVGRVFSLSDSFSYGLLLDDPNSRVPVRIDPMGREGIAVGIGDGRVKVLYLKTTEGLIPGMTVVSTGKGGVYPPHYQVGLVEKVMEDQVIVRLALKANRLSFIQIQPTHKILREIESHGSEALNTKA